MMVLCSKLRTEEEEEEEEEVSGGKVAEMILAGSRYQHGAARELRVVAADLIRSRSDITEEPAFREKLRGDDALFEFLTVEPSPLHDESSFY